MRVALIHDADSAQQIRKLEARDGYVSDISRGLRYRPELFGEPFSEALDVAMRGPSKWSPGERELFAAFTSLLRQCPF